MTQPDFFGALREVLVREISGCVDLLRVERLSGGASMETYQLVVETTDGLTTIPARNLTASGSLLIAGQASSSASNEAAADASGTE